MNAILPAIAQMPDSIGVVPADHADAARNGLFRLLRSLLREQLLPMHPDIDIGNDYSLSTDAGLLRLGKPEFNSLGALCNFELLTWEAPDETPEELLEPVAALERILTLCGDARDPAWQRIATELENSLSNEILTLAWRRQQDLQILRRCRREGIHDLLAWARRDGGNSSIRLEQWAAIGHPYHPGSKTKLGLSTQEVMRYSPEFGPRVELELIAVHRSLAQVCGLIDGLDYPRWFALNFPDWHRRWQAALPDSADYLPLPIHPWQRDHDLPQRFAAELADGRIRLTGTGFSATPTLSFRTLAPSDNPDQPYIKLPVAAQMTSSVRNLSTPSVENAPRISAILQDILGQRPDIAAALRCQWDEVGLHLNVDNETRDADRYLGVLFRRNPCRLLGKGEQAVVVAALFVPSPLCDQPLIVELMQQAGVTGTDQARAWFRQYCDLLFTGVLNLYLDYGIALEAHQQNLMAVMDAQGRPQGFINRDLGGICIHCATLAKRGWPVNFSPAATQVESRAAARVNIFHAVLQSHIGELIELLDGHFQLGAGRLWGDVSRLLCQYLDRHGERYGHAARQEEYDAFFEQPWPATAFIRMRLENQSHLAVCSPIPNPLTRTPAHDDE